MESTWRWVLKAIDWWIMVGVILLLISTLPLFIPFYNIIEVACIELLNVFGFAAVIAGILRRDSLWWAWRLILIVAFISVVDAGAWESAWIVRSVGAVFFAGATWMASLIGILSGWVATA